MFNKTITANEYWIFLSAFLSGSNKKHSMSKAGFVCCESTVYLLFRIFIHNQTHIRSYLHQIHKPPDCPDASSPIIQTIMHLKYLSKNNIFPVAMFQYTFQQHFLYYKSVPLPL